MVYGRFNPFIEELNLKVHIMELKEVTKNFLREETCSTCAFFYKKDNTCYLNLDMSLGTCEIWSSSISDFIEEETRKRVEERVYSFRQKL